MIDMEIEFMSQLWTIRAAKPKELVDCLGLCDPTTNTIIIDPDLPASVMLQTLTHEWVHLIEMTMNLCLTEQQVDCMAAGILHLLATNPELYALYQARVLEEQE
jgi:hypothetical protein